MDVTALGFPVGEIPFTGLRFFPSDQALLQAGSSFVPASGRLHIGRICTGDSFLSGREESRIQSLRRELSGDAVEMEGAAAALAACVNTIPFLLVRTISDKAGEKPPRGVRSIIKMGAENSLQFVLHLFAKLS
jgi:nucleoside phosphorylase